MLLDTTTKSLEVLLGEATATTECAINADYDDVTISLGNPSGFVAGASDGATSGVTAVTAVAAPGANVQRRIRSLSIYNADTISHTVKVRLNNSSTLRLLTQVTLAAGQSLTYADGRGFFAA